MLGTAGTGNTVLALHCARLLAKSGRRLAVIGKPRHLRLQLRTQLRISHIMCGEPRDVFSDLYGAKALATNDAGPLWATILSLVEQNGPRLDHVIIDESQSCHQDDLDAMPRSSRQGVRVLLLADLYPRDNTGRWRLSGEYQEH